MKFHLLMTSVLLISIVSLSAQYNPPTEETHELLESSTLEVVLTGEQDFDETLKKVLKEEYTLGDYTYLTESEFHAAHENKDDICALARSTGKFEVPISSKTVLELKNEPFFGVINKYKEQSGAYNRFNLGSYVLNFPSEEGLDLESSLRLYVRSLNNESYDRKSKRLKELKSTAQGLTFLVPDSFYNCSLAEIEEVYSFKVEMASNDRIQQAILDKEDVILDIGNEVVIEGPLGDQGVNFHTFIACKTGELIHWTTRPFYAKTDAEKRKAAKIKAEQKALETLVKTID